MERIKIGITQGDINGIGYELILNTFEAEEMASLCTPIIYGSPKVATFHRKALGNQTSFQVVEDAERAKDGVLNMVNCFGEEEQKIELGQASEEAGASALVSLNMALEDLKVGKIDALVTSPVNNATIKLEDGGTLKSQTAYIETVAGEGKKALKIFIADHLRIALATDKIPVSEIPAHINKEALAAHHIANQMADLTFMLALGIGSATTIRVSHQLGKGDLHAVRMASHASVHLCLLMNTIGAAIMIFGRNIIPYIFTNDPEVVPIASTLLIIAGTLQYVDGLQCIGAAMLRGIQDVRVPMRIALFAYLVVALPLGLYLTFPLGLGAKGMWIAFVVALAIPAVLFHVRFNRQMRKMENGQLKIENI